MSNELPRRAQAAPINIDAKGLPKPETLRRHVLNRAMQEKSGRLYCNDELDFEIPSLEFYAAR